MKEVADGYQWVAEWSFRGIDADAVGAELDALTVNGRKATTAEVLDWIKENPESELHKCIEWNDAEAAYRHRLQQVGKVMRSLRRKIVSGGETIRLERRFFHISEGGYVNKDAVLSNDDFLQDVVERAVRDLENWKQRYSEIQHLSKKSVSFIDLAIDELKQNALPAKKRARKRARSAEAQPTAAE